MLWLIDVQYFAEIYKIPKGRLMGKDNDTFKDAPNTQSNFLKLSSPPPPNAL